MAAKRSDYRIVPGESTQEILIIRDMDVGGLSITNDAERVVTELCGLGALLGGRRLMYYDSDGELDEIVVKDNRFVGFAPGPR